MHGTGDTVVVLHQQHRTGASLPARRAVGTPDSADAAFHPDQIDTALVDGPADHPLAGCGVEPMLFSVRAPVTSQQQRTLGRVAACTRPPTPSDAVPCRWGDGERTTPAGPRHPPTHRAGQPWPQPGPRAPVGGRPPGRSRRAARRPYTHCPGWISGRRTGRWCGGLHLEEQGWGQRARNGHRRANRSHRGGRLRWGRPRGRAGRTVNCRVPDRRALLTRLLPACSRRCRGEHVLRREDPPLVMTAVEPGGSTSSSPTCWWPHSARPHHRQGRQSAAEGQTTSAASRPARRRWAHPPGHAQERVTALPRSRGSCAARARPRLRELHAAGGARRGSSRFGRRPRRPASRAGRRGLRGRSVRGAPARRGRGRRASRTPAAAGRRAGARIGQHRRPAVVGRCADPGTGRAGGGARSGCSHWRPTLPALRAAYGPVYGRAMVPAGGYAGALAVHTIGVANLLICADTLPYERPGRSSARWSPTLWSWCRTPHSAPSSSTSDHMIGTERCRCMRGPPPATGTCTVEPSRREPSKDCVKMVAEPSRRLAVPAYGAVTDPTATSGSRDDDDVRWNTVRTEITRRAIRTPQGVLGKPRRVVRRLHLHRVRRYFEKQSSHRRKPTRRSTLRHLRGHLPHAAVGSWYFGRYADRHGRRPR